MGETDGYEVAVKSEILSTKYEINSKFKWSNDKNSVCQQVAHRVRLFERMKMNHWTWPTPDTDRLVKEIEEGDEGTRAARAERLRFIREEFGPAYDILLVGGMCAMFALREMTFSFVVGHYMATILLAQVFVEHSLGGSFMLSGDDDTATGGFAKLIKESVSAGTITAGVGEKLDELRRMRNPYTHPNPAVSSRSYMGRMLEQEVYDPEALAEKDARIAVRTVVEFLREGSPDWNPHNPEWKRD